MRAYCVIKNILITGIIFESTAHFANYNLVTISQKSYVKNCDE